jgi:L-arabinose isomerase
MASTETQPVQDGQLVQTRPRIGLLGIMQTLYDDMLPGITERQAAYAAEVAAALGDLVDVDVAPPVKDRASAEQAVRDIEARGADGLLVVMLTYGPAMNVSRALAGTRCRSAWPTSSRSEP